MPRWTEMMPLDQLQRAPRNPKQHDEETIGASLDRFGYVEAVALDERTGRLVAGHGRLDKLEEKRAAGQGPPEGVEVDADGNWLVPVQRGWASRSDSDAEAYLLTSNNAGAEKVRDGVTVGGMDHDLLAEMMGTYAGDDAWLVGTGYTNDDVAALLHETGATTAAAVAFLAGFGGTPEPDPDPPVSPAEGEDWVVVSFTMAAADRKVVLDALDVLRRDRELNNRAEALVELCRQP